MLSPVDERLAFLVVAAGGERSLRVLVPGGGVAEVTYNAGASGLGRDYQIDLATPPQWSDDGSWLAFLGEKPGNASSEVEVFVAEVKTSTVIRLTHGGNHVVAFRWSGPDQNPSA